MNDFPIFDLLYDQVEFPEELISDISKLGYFSRKYNISFEDIEKGIENKKQFLDTEYIFLANVWIDKAKEAQKYKDGPKGIPLDAPLYDEQGGKYKAWAILNHKYDRNKPIIEIYQYSKDDKLGTITGVPHQNYFSSTPASYYAETLLEHGSDSLCIDGGSQWYIFGKKQLIEEIIKRLANFI